MNTKNILAVIKRAVFFLCPLSVIVFASAELMSWASYTENGFFINKYYTVILCSVMCFVVMFAGFIQKKSIKKSILFSGIAAVFSAGVTLAAMLFVSKTGFFLSRAKEAEIVFVFSAFVCIAVANIIASVYVSVNAQKLTAAVCIFLSFCITLIPAVKQIVLPMYYLSYSEKAVSPVGLGKYTEEEKQLVTNADFYVSPKGSDNNPGTFEKPFKTVEQARDKIRSINKDDLSGITVAIKAGSYLTDGVEFTEDDSGTEDCPITYCAYGDGDVELRNAVMLNYIYFSAVTKEDVLEKLNSAAAKEVLEFNLKKIGISKEKITALPAVNSMVDLNSSDVSEKGGTIALFANKTRQTPVLASSLDADIYDTIAELDTPGEWYFDNDSLTVYVYPDKGFETASVRLLSKSQPVININGADYITFSNITFSGSCTNAVKIEGNNNCLDTCAAVMTEKSGIEINGSRNTVKNCSVSLVGESCIIINGGDSNTLLPAENSVDNNLFTRYSELHSCNMPAAVINGVGNSFTHNEICNAPSEAIYFSGNNHTIEYNSIHNVCLSNDAVAAVYSEKHLEWYGTKINFNCLYNIGSENNACNGIALYDGISGITVFGNVFVNIPQNGLYIGGGRDNTVKNNVIVNSGEYAIYYDDSIFAGAVSGENALSKKGGVLWQQLGSSAYKSESWQKAYPSLSKISDDFGNTDNADFALNPSGSEICDNVIVNIDKSLGFICNRAEQYSNIGKNGLFSVNSMVLLFGEPSTGNYTVSDSSIVYSFLPAFEYIPVEEIGRY